MSKLALTPGRSKNCSVHAAQTATNSASTHSVNSFLAQQQVIGNQAMQHLLEAGVIQTKLKINPPGDKYEQEANRVADQVMRMSDPAIAPTPVNSKLPQLQGVCVECEEELQQQEQETEEEETVQRKAITDSGFSVGQNQGGFSVGQNQGESEVPSIVNEVLRSTGQPLNTQTRTFMESRFGHDFSQVRVHTDPIAAATANSINAKAFTLGKTIVFGAGQYSPTSSTGRQLLAHELTHVVQQSTPSNRLRSARFLSPQAGSNFVQRSPDRPTKAEHRREQRLKELAKWTSDAHVAWKKLNAVDRNLVVLQMVSNYGVSFASEFLKEVAKGKAHDLVTHYFGRGVGPKPDKLVAGGFQLAQKDSVHEWWVHPSGRTVVRNFTEDKPSNAVPEKTTATRTVNEDTEDWPTRLDPNADHEALFGPVIATRENADASFGKGDVVLYEDGTVELFLEGTTESYVFRPLSDGYYIVYGPDGRRLNRRWNIPKEDIPDPNTDAVE